jgi:hypothetical protein
MSIRIEWVRFLIITVVLSVVIFVLDIAFHTMLAPKIMSGYPAEGYPGRSPADVQPLLPFLFATYVVQMPMFCYLFLRIYPGRGVGNAIWWGIWGGFFVVIPNMQFFVVVDHTTWKMLWIQVVEGMFLMALLTFLFELTYRPKNSRM